MLTAVEASQPTVAEFFAGIGLVRLGLEAAGFRVTWANDVDPAKREMYVGQFASAGHESGMVLRDIAGVTAADVPTGLALAWASFPCIDLSLAGWRRGLNGSYSSVFWSFTRILGEMENDRPPVVALENVVGFATSHGGEDLKAAILALNDLDYSVDLLTLDARRFVPQSRPRMFLIGVRNPPDDAPDSTSKLRPNWLQAPFSDPDLRMHRAALPNPPALLLHGLSTLLEPMSANDWRWWDQARTEAFVASLSPVQADRLSELVAKDESAYRTAYRRTRGGKAVWEVRPDGISGCLRTARGGSSKQAVVQAGNGVVRVRWMTPLEYARLMGAGDYRIEGIRRNQALFGFGDAVCVPVVSWLAEQYLMPIVRGDMQPAALAAAIA